MRRDQLSCRLSTGEFASEQFDSEDLETFRLIMQNETETENVWTSSAEVGGVCQPEWGAPYDALQLPAASGDADFLAQYPIRWWEQGGSRGISASG